MGGRRGHPGTRRHLFRRRRRHRRMIRGNEGVERTGRGASPRVLVRNIASVAGTAVAAVGIGLGLGLGLAAEVGAEAEIEIEIGGGARTEGGKIGGATATNEIIESAAIEVGVTATPIDREAPTTARMMMNSAASRRPRP